METKRGTENFVFGYGIEIVGPDKMTTAVERGIKRFRRDCGMALTEKGPDCTMVLREKKMEAAEQYRWYAESPERMVLEAGDDLGFVFGLLEISRRYLDMKPFWFWMDEPPVKKGLAEIEPGEVVSEPSRVRFRGWFINDEVLLMKWNLDGDNQKSWEMAMEALLRCGGNLVIPGTDKNSRLNRQLAVDMGLWITHHHAEPLGAEMFARAYPDLQASYKEYPELFRKLWQDAIEAQKDDKVIWTLGFRGQGDHPFWENDPQYASDESRGRLISQVIRLQYDMIHRQIPDAVCCTNLYGEIMDLYRKNCIELPDDVIKIWADNGFGKMVSRRQENINPRVDALPGPEEADGHHGLYYHVSFYDLQAANHITMLPNTTEFVARELETCYDRGIRDFWIINSSNIKPHVFNLELVRRLWTGKQEFDPKVYAEEFVQLYYGGETAHRDEIAACYDGFARNSIVYGPNEDDHAGEQFTNYVTRILAWAFQKGERGCVKPLLWATGEMPFIGQVRWFMERCVQKEDSYRSYLDSCEKCAAMLLGKSREHFEDGILLQAHMYFDGLMGAVCFCRSVLAFEEGAYMKAFAMAGQSADWFEDAEIRMRGREHDQWKGFYFNECLSDFKYSAYRMRQLMGHIRNIGDGPHGFLWMKAVTYSENDRKISLISHTDNHPTDESLYQSMKERNYEGWFE